MRGLGSMSILRSTRYVEVPRCAASSSRGVPGITKFVTSAMSASAEDIADPRRVCQGMGCHGALSEDLRNCRV